jgi:hypothetical protein
MVTIGNLISIVSLIIVVIVIYFIYTWVQSLPTTDCPKYGNIHTIGKDGGPECENGIRVEGLCYVDRWTQYGGEATAACTVKYPGDLAFVTNFDIGIDNLYSGDPCNEETLGSAWTYGDGYFKTLGYTCQRGGIITSYRYCESTSPGTPTICREGDYFESACYTESCPEGLTRTEICTCST